MRAILEVLCPVLLAAVATVFIIVVMAATYV